MSADGDPAGLGDRFVVRRRIGSGGFGVVYEALDLRRDMVVACKTLHALDPEALYRLKREFRALADVVHPNLVTLHELLHDQGRWFFTMELIAGVDFIEHVRGAAYSGVAVPSLTTAASTVAAGNVGLATGAEAATVIGPRMDRAVVPLDLVRLRAALAQLAIGLDALHQAGKLHCDIKPSNVLCEPGGRVVLLDFSLVTELGHGSTDGFAGTPSYAAPEQAAGEVTPASDWYGVGVMLYEALTARLPFAGAPLQVLALKQQLDAVPPRDRAVGVPDDLDALCAALIARDPSRRPSGAAVLDALAAGGRRARRRASLGGRDTAGDAAADLLGRDVDDTLGGDDDDGLAGAAPAAPLGRVADGRFGGAARDGFFGRAAELSVLRAALARTVAGHAAAVLVRGPSGVGKSALVARFTRELGGSALVIAGRCYPRESVPFRAFDAAIDALARHLGEVPGVAEAVPDDLAGALVTLFPVLGRVARFAAAPAAAGGTPERVRQIGFAGLRQLLVALARRRPVVIAIDDVQWADADSQALVAEVFGGSDPPPVLVLCTAREGAALELPSAEQVALAPLDAADAAALARALVAGGSAADAARIAAESAGLPLFIRELVAEGAHAPGVGLDGVLRLRVARQSPRAREMCELLAVAGAPLSARVIQRAAGVDAEAGARTLAELAGDGLVRTAAAGDGVELYHDRIRDAVCDGFVPSEQAARHRALARALIDAGVADERPELVVHHLSASDQAALAARYALRGARRAAAGLAFEQAAVLLEVALIAPPPGEDARAVRLELASALASARRGAEAAEQFLRAADGADVATAIDCRRQAAEQLMTSGHIERGIALIDGVLAEVDRRLPSTPASALAQLMYQRARLRLRGGRWTLTPRERISLADQRRFEVLRSTAFGLAMIDNVRGAVYQSRSLALALDLGDPAMIGRALGAEAVFQGSQGALGRRRARALIAEARAIGRDHDDPMITAWAIGAAGVVDLVAGDLANAEHELAESHALFLARTAGTAWETNSVLLSLLMTIRMRGDLAALVPRTEEHLRDAQRRHDRYVETSLRRATNILWLVRDDPDGAMANLAAAAWSPYEQGFHLQHMFELEALGEIALYVGDARDARAALAKRFRALDRSLLTRVLLFRALRWWLDARLTLAGPDPGGVRVQARVGYLAARLAAERVSYASVWSRLARAGAAAARGDEPAVRGHLETAIMLGDRDHLGLCAAMARLRLSERVGAAAGDHRARAAAWIAAQGVRDADRLARVVIPIGHGHGHGHGHGQGS